MYSIVPCIVVYNLVRQKGKQTLRGGAGYTLKGDIDWGEAHSVV